MNISFFYTDNYFTLNPQVFS